MREELKMAWSSPNRRPIYSDLNSYAQGYWTFFHKNVRAATGAPDDLMLACGVAIGFEDTESPINRVHSARASIDEFATFID